MKRQLLSVLALAAMSVSAAKAAPTFTYFVDIDTTSLVSASDAPYSLDFQLITGSGELSNTVTLSNFVFTGGSATGSSNPYSGNASGNMSSGITLTSSAFASGISQTFSATTTDIKFTVTTTEVLSNNPDGFSIDIFGATDNVHTGAPGGSDLLLQQDLNFNDTTSAINTYNSTSPSGVKATVSAVPEPSTYGLLGAGALAAASFVRRRRKTA